MNDDPLDLDTLSQILFAQPQVPGAVDGQVTQELPQEEPAPVPDIQYTWEVVVDTNHPNVGFAIYNPETSHLVIHIHNGFDPQTLLNPKVQTYLRQNKYTIPVTAIIQWNINPLEIITCKFFTAPRNSFESGTPVEISTLHEYDRPFTNASCANPKLSPEYNSHCIADQQQPLCSLYQPETWRTEVAYRSEEKTTVWKVRSLRKGIGFNHYIVESTTDDGVVETLGTFNAVDQGEDAKILAEKTINGAVEGILDIVELDKNDNANTTKTYYEYAFN